MFQSHDHHVKGSVCLTRPPYRDGKKARAVKAYTIIQESKYLLIQNIPSIAGVVEQLLPYFSQHGLVEQYWRLDGYVRKDSIENNEFYDTILIKYAQIQHARVAKCRLDDLNFMGSNLHICYVPECESVDDLREKFNERRAIVQQKSHFSKYMKRLKHSKSVFQRKSTKQQSSVPTVASTTVSSLQSFEQTRNEIRTKMRDIVERSNLISLALQQEITRKKRLQY